MFYFHENLPADVVNPPAMIRVIAASQPRAMPVIPPVIHKPEDKKAKPVTCNASQAKVKAPPLPFSTAMRVQVSGDHTGPAVPLLRHMAHVLNWQWGGVHGVSNRPPLIVSVFTYQGETIHALLSNIASQLPARDTVRITEGPKSVPTLSIDGEKGAILIDTGAVPKA